jgi:3-hydroxy acid dehydrogenase/malonic semialdehyde reductase
MLTLDPTHTVLITGASAGFGMAFAKTFARAGARLILIARRKERLETLADELHTSYGTHSLCIELDITDTAAVQEKLGQLPIDFATPTILINNAGMVKGMHTLWETPPADYTAMLDTNIKGLLNINYLMIPKMLAAGKGHIINIGSISGHDTYPGGGVYCATKYAVRAITDTLRKELVATPLRVSMISPGMANTEFSLVRFDGNQAQADAVYQGVQPLSAEDIADIALFMATRPQHVAIADVIVYPTHQASVSLVSRQSS